MNSDDHPNPVPGAAQYWADGIDVLMKDTEGHVSVIDTKGTPRSASNAAKKWQIRENKVVASAAKKK